MADIELVIKIPEVEYKHLTNKEKFYSLEKNKQEWLINKILNRVIDGAILSKGHGNIYDENDVKKEIKNPYQCQTVLYGLKLVKPIIEADKAESEDNGNVD